jgi:hypothetical protein
MSGSAAPDAVAGRWRGRPPRHRWRPWLALAAAAVAVAVAVTLVAVRNATTGRPASPPPAASANAVPTYYVALQPVPELGLFSSAPEAVVGDTFTGKRVATVPAPAGLGFGGVTAAGDDRMFVLSVEPRSGASQPVRTRWYLLRLSPGAAPAATLRQLPIPPKSLVADSFSAVLSPDGTMLAIATEVQLPGSTPTGAELWVYSTVTGALLHAWSSSSPELLGFDTANAVSWTSGGHELAFQTAATGTGPVVVRLLPADDRGHDLLADSRTVLSFMTSVSSPHNCADGYLMAGNGKTAVCGSATQVRVPASSTGGKACPATTHAYNAADSTAVLQFSTTTGEFTGPLDQIGPACQVDRSLALYWANDDGSAVLGYSGYAIEGPPGTLEKTVGQFGLFTRGKFTPLPAPLESYQAYPAITAW